MVLVRVLCRNLLHTVVPPVVCVCQRMEIGHTAVGHVLAIQTMFKMVKTQRV